jgi:hypothetical protein
MSLKKEVLKDWIVWQKLKKYIKENKASKELVAMERGYAELFSKILGTKKLAR